MSEPGAGDGHDFISRPRTRRNFLTRVAQAGTALALGDRLLPKDAPKEKPPTIKSGDLLREFVTRNKEALTFEQARDLLPKIVDVFVASGSPKPEERILADTLIVSGHPDAEAAYRKAYLNAHSHSESDAGSNPFDHPTMQQFLKDYPHLNRGTLSSDLAQGINGYNFIKSVGNFDYGKVLLFLYGINNTQGASPVDLGRVQIPAGGALLQFTNLAQTTCEPATPAVAYISTALHEMFHYEAEGPKRQLEPEVVSAFRAVMQKRNPDKDFSSYKGTTTGFRASFDTEGDSKFLMLGEEPLEEFISQYLTTQLCLTNRLPIMSARGLGPVETANFQKVLAQSEINEKSLRKMHAGGDVKGLLMGIAAGAKGVNLQSEQEMLEFSLGLLLPDPAKPPAPWEFAFKPHFPSINTNYFQTADFQQSSRLTAPGCGYINPTPPGN